MINYKKNSQTESVPRALGGPPKSEISENSTVIAFKIWHVSFDYRSTFIILFLKNVALGPPEVPKNLKTPENLYLLLIHFWTKFCSNAGMLLYLYSKEKLMLSLPLGRQ